MQFNTEIKKRIKIGAYEEQLGYGHVLQFYKFPPTENITLQEFEELATERLKVLKVVETVGYRKIREKSDYENAMTTELKKLSNDGVLKGLTRIQMEEEELPKSVLEERRRDHVSHFILRLAYCQTDELKRWFIRQEVDLFRYRFGLQRTGTIKEFLKFYDLSYTVISKDEKMALLPKLISSSYNLSASQVARDDMDYYKVHFTEVLELVRGTKVYLEKGYAYVPKNELVVIISNAFRSRLSHDLAVMSRSLSRFSEEDRLKTMLTNLSNQYLGQDYSKCKSTSGHVTADMIDPLAKTAFPLCMQNLHQSLRQSHHLKHWGRQQYGLFLKGIGLSLEEALRFWRMEFSRMMDGDKFDKQYAYNIRHNYGKEGKRADYTPYTCIKIITSNPPAAGDCHGCPYRHFDVDFLKQRLQSFNLSSDGIKEILDIVKQGHYQTACGKFFELRYGSDSKFVPEHPNQYFEESQKISTKESKTGNASSTKPHGVTLVPVASGKKIVPQVQDDSMMDESCWEDLDPSEFS